MNKTWNVGFIRVLPSFILFATVGIVSDIHAADLNGYTAQYECRAGNPACDVDMTPPPCEVTIQPGDDWYATITNNPSARSFCVQCGDHRVFHDFRDLVTLPESISGSVQARRWLRYSCPNDNGAHPVLQQPAARAYIPRIRFEGADYWILDRLTLDFDGGDINTGIEFALDSASTNNILNRLLIEDASAHFVRLNQGNADNTLQNSVVRNPVPTMQYEAQCVEVGSGPRFRAINNEIYNCQKAISIGNGHIDHPGLVIENNDLYATPEVYTDCQGNFTPSGSCGLTEDMISLKAGGTAADPALVIHNRLWGSRTGDPNVSLTANGDGDAMGVGISGNSNSPLIEGYPGGDWILFRHNIVWDSGIGLGSAFPSAENVSLIGNVFWDMAESQRDPNFPGAINTYGGINQSEFYFNTFVAGDAWLKAYGDTYNDDFRCNLIVGSAANVGGLSSGAQVANNAFYATPPFTTESPSSDIVGSTVAAAQQTEFCFFRKLLTGAEQFCIPNTVPTANSPHRNACNSSIGVRAGIGINDASGSSWTDLLGRARDGTPDMGALEFVDGTGPTQGPFGGTARNVPGLIEAEHFDEGGPNVAYYDTTAANEGGQLRSTAVDLETSTENGHAVGWTQAGEWLEYTVNVVSTGTYSLELRVASDGPGGTLHIEVDGTDISGPITIPNTGGWQTWQTITRTGIGLIAGTHVLRLAFDVNGATGDVGNVNYLRFTSVGQPSQSPYLGQPHAIPGTIQIEDYDLGGQGVAYYDDSSGNRYGAYRNDDVDLYAGNDGPYLAENQGGEWIEYTVNIAAAGDYTLEVRVASAGGGGTIHVEFDGVDKTGSIIIPDTGGWQTWTVVSRVVNLSDGQHILRLVQDLNGSTGYVGNIDYMRITALNTGQSPYGGAPHAIPGTIQAEDYDLGGMGVAYYDNSPGNLYGAYRNDDVDLYGGNDGPYLAENQAGEWLEYSVDVATAGDYVLELRVASAGAGGTVHVERNGIDKTGSIVIPDTGGWQNWTIVTRVVNLDAGRYVLRLAQDTNGSTGYVGNIDYLRFAPASNAVGTILRQYWLGIPGDFVTDLTSHPNYPNNPSGSDQLTFLEAPTDWPRRRPSTAIG